MISSDTPETGMRLISRIDTNLYAPEANMLAELYMIKLRSLCLSRP